MGHGRVDETGRHRIHRDVTAGIFAPDGFCKADDGCLRGRVIGLPRVPDHPDDRSDVDDATIPLLGHWLQDRFRAVERTVQIDLKHQIPIFFFHPQQQAFRTCSTIALVSLASATLTLMFRDFRPSFSTDSTVSTERPGSRSATAMSAPAWARHSAMARPMPCAAPVTIAVLPCNDISDLSDDTLTG